MWIRSRQSAYKKPCKFVRLREPLDGFLPSGASILRPQLFPESLHHFLF